MRKEIIFVGQGGQGIILMGEIFAKAANLDRKEVACTSSYGAAARGGECSSKVVISNEPIDFPGVMNPDFLVVMSQEEYDKWIFEISSGSKVFFDLDIIKIIKPDKADHVPILATRIATELGSRMAANMVMLGLVAAITELISIDSLLKVVEEESGKFSEINLEAVKRGYKIGKEKQFLTD